MKPLRILIVEDDAIIAKLMRDLLAKEGYEVQIAATGRAGWDDLQRSHFDLVVLDL